MDDGSSLRSAVLLDCTLQAAVFNPGNIGGRISESSYAPLELAERKARARVEAGRHDRFQRNRKDRRKKQGGLGGLFRKLQEQIKNQQMTSTDASTKFRFSK
jgi:hypothetical protein